MKALTLTQPWASLVAHEKKQWETRSWPTKQRGWVAIHAAKSFPQDARHVALWSEYRRAIVEAGHTKLGDLPLGAVLAVAQLRDCQSTKEIEPWLTPREIDFGCYDAGRYAFHFINVRRVDEPIPCRGMLGFWELPDAVSAALQRLTA